MTSALLTAVSGGQGPLSSGVGQGSVTATSTQNGAAKSTQSSAQKPGFELGASLPVGSAVKVQKVDRRRQELQLMQEKHQQLELKRKQQQELIHRQQEQIKRQQKQIQKQIQMSGRETYTVLWVSLNSGKPEIPWL